LQAHLRNIPDYIVPKALKKVTGQGRPTKRKFTPGTGGPSAAKRKFDKKQNDALFLLSKKRK
jgi:hypothetical protein